MDLEPNREDIAFDPQFKKMQSGKRFPALRKSHR